MVGSFSASASINGVLKRNRDWDVFEEWELVAGDSPVYRIRDVPVGTAVAEKTEQGEPNEASQAATKHVERRS